jgi:hypothetical protein
MRALLKKFVQWILANGVTAPADDAAALDQQAAELKN